MYTNIYETCIFLFRIVSCLPFQSVMIAERDRFETEIAPMKRRFGQRSIESKSIINISNLPFKLFNFENARSLLTY